MSDINPYIEGRKKEIELNQRKKLVENDIEFIKRDLEAKTKMLLESRKNHVESYQEQINEIKNVALLGKLPYKETIKILKTCDILYAGMNDSSVHKYGIGMNKLLTYYSLNKLVILPPIVSVFPATAIAKSLNASEYATRFCLLKNF